MSVSEELISQGNTCVSLYRPERLVMLCILWESQVPPALLETQSGLWSLAGFTGPRCLYSLLGKAVIRVHVSW